MLPSLTGWGQTRSEVTDVMDQSWTDITGTSYSDFLNKAGSASDAVYAGNCAGDKSSIQLRSNNNNSGIVSTTSGGTVTKVTVTWQNDTQNGRTLNVYGKNSAYSAASDLYGNNAGTLIGTIVKGTSTELTITDSYAFIGMRSASGAMYLSEIDVTWEAGGSTPPTPTTYTVTFDAGDGTFVGNSDFPNANNTVEAGTYTLPSATPATGYTFNKWNIGDQTYNAGASYTVSGNADFVASYTQNGGGTGGDDHWVLTELADLTSSDVFVIVGNNGSNYAMSNDKGTGNPPTAVAVTVTGNEITGTVAANIQWNISGNATNGYTFYPNGSTSTWLYCTNTNNGVRVGTNTNKTFGVKGGYLMHSATSRYVGIYNSQDWRCYTGYTTGNIAGQTFAFYKKVTGGVVPPSITANNVEIAYDATSGEITYTLNNPATNGSLSVLENVDWISDAVLSTTESKVTFTTTANEATTPREGIITITYTYGDNETVSKDVTVTQAAAPVIYNTMQAIFDKATEVGNTATNVNIALQNWVVSGVSTNGKNVFVTDGTKGFVIFDNGGNMGFAVGNILSGTVSCKVQLYNGFAEITQLNSSTESISIATGGTVTAANIAMADLAGVNTGALLHYDNLTCSIDNNKYYLTDGTTTLQVFSSLSSFDALTAGKSYNITGVYQQYNTNSGDTKEILPRSAADIEEVVVTTPSVTVTPATVNAPFAYTEGTLALTYENITEIVDFGIQFCDANGDELQGDEPDWILIAIVEPEGDEGYSANYFIERNDGEARTAYFKAWTYDENVVYSNIVTVNQAQFVIDYAELPFDWTSSFGEMPTGITNSGVSNGSNGLYLKFDSDGDYITLKINESPGTLSYDVKGNPSSGVCNSTFEVETSSDGEDWETLDTNEGLNIENYETKEYDLDEGVRFIRWTINKDTGNVAMNNIHVTKYVAPTPAITVEATAINATAEEFGGTLNVTYTAIESYDISWFESDGETEADEPDWIIPAFDEMGNIEYIIYANEGEARTAYFKVYGLDGEMNDIYSELVTVSQAGVPQEYTLTVEPFENLELITFVNDEVVMEEDGEIQVTEGAQVMLSIVADEGYVIETLMVNGVDHADDIDDGSTYTFEMPAEDVTISATAVEYVAPVGGDYVRITSLDQLTDGSVVVIAARYDVEHTNGYYAMQNTLNSGKATGTQFTSTTSGGNEILPASFVDDEDDYYWVVDESGNGYTFTNANGDVISYNSSANFNMNGSKTEWTIDRSTSEATAMAGEYTGFVITNYTTTDRAFAFNGSVFGAYSTTNIAGSGYNFYLDFFVQSEAPVVVTYDLTINGYTSDKTGWYLIASPVATTPEEVENMLTNDIHDLYRFNQYAEEEWENYYQHQDDFDIVPGQGYLYANRNTVTLKFSGELYNGEGDITLENAGWNLVGNPFNSNVTVDADEFMIMNEAGSQIIPADEEHKTIAPMQGIFVHANEEGETVTFIQPEGNAHPNNNPSVVMNLTQNRSSVIDRAIVRFGESKAMPKFQLFENHTKLYIPQNGEDFSVVSAEAQGEMPVNFVAAKDGQYTITINPENVEMSYLHLIDNIAGQDIDLLATQSYTFNGKRGDYASRFKLVFSANDNAFNGESDDFAFISNGQIILTGDNSNATLQVVDILGRVVSSQMVNGNSAYMAPVANGVYVLRLINGNDVKTQKIVVK